MIARFDCKYSINHLKELFLMEVDFDIKKTVFNILNLLHGL